VAIALACAPHPYLVWLLFGLPVIVAATRGLLWAYLMAAAAYAVIVFPNLFPLDGRCLVLSWVAASLLAALRHRLVERRAGDEHRGWPGMVCGSGRKAIGGIAGGLVLLLLLRGISITLPLGWAVVYGAVLWESRAARAMKSEGPRHPILTGLLAAIGLVIGVVVVEVVPLPPPPEVPNDIFERHPSRGVMLRPNMEHRAVFYEDSEAFTPFPVHTSSLRLRNEEIPAKRPEEFRILMLGDSFTFGWGLQPHETIPEQLRQHLSKEGVTTDFRVINAGVPGYGPKQERDLLHEFGFGMEPDLVILQMFPNDIADSAVAEGVLPPVYHPSQAKIARMALLRGTWQGQLSAWMEEQSQVVGYWAARVERPYPLVDYLNMIRLFPPAPALRPAPSLLRPPSLETQRREWSPELEFGWSRFQVEVAAIHADCEAREIAFFAYCLPHHAQLDYEQWVAMIGEATVNDYQYRVDVAAMEGWLRERSIPYVPVLRVLSGFIEDEKLYYPEDGHLHPSGAWLVAQVLKTQTIRRGFLTPEE
jgi:hypothetical protein